MDVLVDQLNACFGRVARVVFAVIHNIYSCLAIGGPVFFALHQTVAPGNLLFQRFSIRTETTMRLWQKQQKATIEEKPDRIL
jgi:hypothetical protein